MLDCPASLWRDPLRRASAYASGWSWSSGSCLLSCFQWHSPLEGQMRPESDVLPAPAVGEELSLESRGEQLRVQELIAESPLERLGSAVLPREPGSM